MYILNVWNCLLWECFLWEIVFEDFDWFSNVWNYFYFSLNLETNFILIEIFEMRFGAKLLLLFFFSFLMKVNVSKTERYRIEKSIADNRGRIKRNSFPIDMIIFNDKSTFIRRLLNKYIFDGLNGWREGTKNSKEFRYFHPIRNLK